MLASPMHLFILSCKGDYRHDATKYNKHNATKKKMVTNHRLSKSGCFNIPTETYAQVARQFPIIKIQSIDLIHNFSIFSA